MPSRPGLRRSDRKTVPLRAVVTATLRREHDLIRRAVAILRSIAESVTAGASFPSDDFAALIRFLRECAEHQHHRKEESLLLVTLAADADDAAEDVGGLLRDHEETRELVYMLTLFWDPIHDLPAEGRAAFTQVAGTYADRIERHMAHEEANFFPLAERMIPGDEKLDLVREFAAIDHDRPTTEHWAQQLDLLAARWH